MISSERKNIVAAARSWLHTPYRHFQCCKGVGVDCAHLIIGVGKDVGIFSRDFDVPYYTPQWLLQKKSELLLSTMIRHNFIEKSVYTEGDILVFEIDEVLCHVAIFIGNDRAIHAHLNRHSPQVREFRLFKEWKNKYLKHVFSYPGIMT